jgi:CRP/FNR family transcriptional regulator, cyclic AMP receptor protein
MPSQISPQQLSGVELVQDFSDEELQQLSAVCEDLQFEADQVIFATGELSSALYILLNGTIQIELEAPATQETLLAELQPPSVFGESSFFHQAPHSATAVCTTPVRVVRLTRDNFDRLAQTNPVVAYHLGANAARILSARLQQTDHWIAEMLQAQQDARIHARWRDFRQQLGHSFSFPGGFGLGGGST